MRIVRGILVLAVIVAAVALMRPAAIGGSQNEWRAVPGNEHLGRNLESVTAINDRDAYAVGIDYTTDLSGRGGKAAVERWDGARWTTYASVPGATELTSVATQGADTLWVTGYHDRNSGPLRVWRNRGDAWSRVKMAGLPPHLSARVLASRAHVWLVGTVEPAFADSGALVASYRPSPRPHWTVRRLHAGGFFGGLVRTARDAYAVGGTSQYVGHGHPLVAHWNGRHWSTTVLREMRGSFVAVAATGRNDAMAVGQLTGRASVVGGIAAHWTGRRWLPQQFRYPQVNVFTSVAGVSGVYWASMNWRSASQFASYVRYANGAWQHGRGSRQHPPSYLRGSPVMGLTWVPGTNDVLSVGGALGEFGRPTSFYPIRERAVARKTQEVPAR
jgi:hypothetical protein